MIWTLHGRLVPMLGLRGLKVPQTRMYLRALDLYVTYPSSDFEDVLTLSQMERMGISELYSYDTDFDGVHGVTRAEPAA